MPTYICAMHAASSTRAMTLKARALRGPSAWAHTVPLAPTRKALSQLNAAKIQHSHSLSQRGMQPSTARTTGYALQHAGRTVN